MADRVRDRTFQAVTNLDAHLAVVFRHDDDEAVVGALAADLPGFGKADAELLDGLGLGRRQQQHGDLRLAAALDGRKLRFEAAALRGVERVGQIGDAGVQRRQRHRLGRQADGRQQGQPEQAQQRGVNTPHYW